MHKEGHPCPVHDMFPQGMYAEGHPYPVHNASTRAMGIVPGGVGFPGKSVPGATGPLVTEPLPVLVAIACQPPGIVRKGRPYFVLI
jgi:hypothetical protein